MSMERSLELLYSQELALHSKQKVEMTKERHNSHKDFPLSALFVLYMVHSSSCRDQELEPLEGLNKSQKWVFQYRNDRDFHKVCESFSQLSMLTTEFTRIIFQ